MLPVFFSCAQYEFGSDLKSQLLVKMTDNLKAAEPSQCGRVGYVFTKQLESQVSR
jgi:hypothetical protein